jgi:hypothetical protein
LLAIGSALLAPAGALAQFGHPMKGQWSGSRTLAGQESRVLLNLEWDGRAVTGVINPGPNAATVKSVAFDYSKIAAWGVKITAEGKDESGQPVTIALDGTLENLGAYTRHFHGTWTQGGRKGEFVLTRN